MFTVIASNFVTEQLINLRAHEFLFKQCCFIRLCCSPRAPRIANVLLKLRKISFDMPLTSFRSSISKYLNAKLNSFSSLITHTLSTLNVSVNFVDLNVPVRFS